MNTRLVSSPASTGGAGTFFEQHVDAYWLAQLLVRGIPPILHDCGVVEVHLQTAHLGWHTDDFLVIGENGSGSRRKLAGQVKRTFTVSATDEECKKTVQGFWQDFGNANQFSPAVDRLAIVTLRGTNALLEYFSGLLDCSRSARDGTDFEHRLATTGFLSSKAVHYCDELRTIIGEVEGRSVTAAEIWPFLRVLYILSLDLHSATRQTEGMLKTLLAHTTTGESDAMGTAEASWNALLGLVGDAVSGAHSFRYGDLPEVLRRRHSVVGWGEQRALRALTDHSALILGGIRSTIGSDLHLRRGHLVQQVIEQLESTQVVLISGAAGNGKSVIAKDVIDSLTADHFVFSFRAEEFAQPHFDTVLQSSGIPASAATLAAMLASQDRKVLLVESVERLLEKSTRDAFTDLLTLVARDRSWRLLLTCRDYSADLVRACFLGLTSVGHSVVTVPPLDDGELAEVEAAHAMLGPPLASAGLRRILRNPYYLNRALEISWSADRPLPESEREFRALFWQQIVRAEHRLTGGMPRLREEAFVEIALQRARTLTPYVACSDLDPAVVDALRYDSLIVSPEQSAVLVAPAHDILEDWAILHWIEEQLVTRKGSFSELSATIGTHPAVRRAYRKWVVELVERDPGTADQLFQAAIIEVGVPAQFRDDTLVSLLRAPLSAAFLERHGGELLANNKELLRRVIHLLRVACVTTPAWLPTSAGSVSLLNIPDGPAWASILRLVQAHLLSFVQEDRSLLLGLVEDWSRGVSWQNPYPEGSKSVAAIAHWLLPGHDDYHLKDQRKRSLQVIAKIPNADRDRFATLLRGNHGHNERDRALEDFREIIFEGLEGMPAARDMPELIVDVAEDYLLCSESDLGQNWGYRSSLGLEPLFGIKEARSHEFFPASAYRGPFLPLLRFHPRTGLDCVIAVFNHSAEWYAHPRVSERVEPPFEIELTFADETSRKQWCNARLWNLYRGTSVGPNVLQSLLMALERWLLEFAETRSHELDKVLLDILRRSDSAALTAVVASVATAFPHASGETLLVLLRSSVCIRLDRQRLVHESQSPSRLSDLMPQLHARNKIYEVERKEADVLPHRRRDLETAIMNLQLGPFASRIHEILDRYRAEMPPVDEQDEENCTWRLAMHRMDLRQYTIAEDMADASAASEGATATEDNGRYIRLEPNDPEPDVKELVDRGASQFQALNARLGLLVWGLRVFGHEEDTICDPAQWRQRLQEARIAPIADGGEEYDQSRDGPGLVAAVCVRDHWEEMSDDARKWCVDAVCSEVEREGDRWSQSARVQRNSMSADRPCAWVLPLLLGKPLDKTARSRVLHVLVVALTHSIDEVRWYAALGIGRYLWTIDRDLALRCVNALAMEAVLVQQAADAELRRPYYERRQIDDIEAEAASTIRQRFLEPDGIPDDALRMLDPTQWFGAEASKGILAILGQAQTEPVAVAAFERLARTLVEWWDADDDRRANRNDPRRERNYETEAVLSNLIQNFLLQTSAAAAITIVQPILDAVDRHPREVRPILLGLIGAEDRQPNTEQFWVLWDLFAQRVRYVRWLARIDDDYPGEGGMVSAIFLGTGWKEEVRHWRSLEGYAGHIHVLFEDLPVSSTVLDSYVRFLYHIGEQSLPESFACLAKRIQQGDPRQMMTKGNTVFMLEVLLQRYVYGKSLQLKRERPLREAVLFLLDLLVEQGSSAAFRMRDDFVTPMSR